MTFDTSPSGFVPSRRGILKGAASLSLAAATPWLVLAAGSSEALPRLPDGFAFLADEEGVLLTDGEGRLLVVPDTA